TPNSALGRTLMEGGVRTVFAPDSICFSVGCREQALAQVCDFHSPVCRVLSEIGISQHLSITDSTGVSRRKRAFPHVIVERMIYFDCSRAFLAFAISASLALSTLGYARSREASVSTMAAPTTTRVNHLLSAGTTYQGLSLVAVFRIMSS